MALSKAECAPGSRVIWCHVPRGGGFSWDRCVPVEAGVTGVRIRRVRIRAQRQAGAAVARWVSPERLLPAETETFAHAVATSRELAPEERDFWLRLCAAEGM